MPDVFNSMVDAEAAVARAQARVKTMTPESLISWLDAALPGMMHHFDDYRRTGEVAHLGEMAMAHMNAGVVIDELLERELNRMGTIDVNRKEYHANVF
jgi:hypothetical protein